METEELAQVIGDLDTFLAMPGGLEMLRRTILKLAVTGELTMGSQFSLRDEESQARSSAGLKEPVDVEADFRPGWIVAPFASLGVLARGRSKHRPRNDSILYSDGTVPLVQTGDVARSKGKVTTYSGLYNDAGVAQSRLWPAGTLCITIAANIGNTGVLQFPACFPDSVVGFVPNEFLVDLRYVEIFLRTIQADLERDAPSTAQKNINLKVLGRIEVKLPPLDEQCAIAERIAMLMQLVDNFELARDVASNSRRALSRGAFRQLGSTLDSTAVENIDDVLAELQDVRDLETAIFDLAVSGSLVEAIDEDGEGLAVIEAALSDGSGTRREHLTPPDLGDVIFPVPDNWAWSRLGTVANYIQRGKTPKYVERSDYPVLSQKCVRWGGIDWSVAKFIAPPNPGEYAAERLLQPGDLLINSTGTGTIGRLCIFEGAADYSSVVADGHVTVARFKVMDPRFVALWMRSHWVQDTVEVNASGSTNQIEWNLAALKKQVVPIPPLKEQARIVQKVDGLMSLVDDLRNQLAS
ncbi:restriction endonuclease subunit S [Streptomyces sp. CAU 1734]|uniref:restriction endonuclease subunit S n=1 Tax=Streptomyces sp. CAU 1734 TaxID=3140360 RepID=UPI0032619D1E